VSSVGNLSHRRILEGSGGGRGAVCDELEKGQREGMPKNVETGGM